MEVYGKERMLRARVSEWHQRFRKDRTDVEDHESSGRPTASKTTNNIREIEKSCPRRSSAQYQARRQDSVTVGA